MQRSDAVAVVLGDPVQYHVIALGGVTAYAAQGLPAGVTIDAATGTISGTPAQVGTYPITVSASNADGTSSATVTVNVVAPDAGPMIYAPLQFDAYNDPHPGGGWFTCALKATGSPSSFQTSETLPPQWTFTAGTFVGPTDQPGIHVIPVSATNANGIGSAAITIRVHAACTQVQQTTGVLHAGDVFRVTLQFNRPVSFSGAAPYLEFHTATDGTARRIPYVSGNGTATLEFAYPITAADAAGDILLYTTIQPAAGSAAATLADQDGMMPGAALPIVGSSVAAASIAAAPVATTTTPTGGGLSAAPSPAPATPVATSSSSVASTTTASTSTSTASTPASAPTSTASATTGATTTNGATSVATTSTPAATPVATSAPSSSDVVVTASSSVTPVSSNSTATGATDSSVAASSTTSTSSTSSAPAPQVDSSRLINLSSRALVSGGDSAHAFIAGFVVSGSTPKRMLLRAVGPGLSPFGVQGALATPQLQVFDASGHAVTAAVDTSAATTSAVGASVGAFSLASGSGDAAEVVTLAPGSYSMQITSGTGSGVALAEAYDADAAQASAPLINLSTRANVGAGEGVLAAGFVVNGSAPKRLLIRGVGPGLAAYGVSGTLADPRVTVYQGNSVVAQNDNWETGQAVDGSQTVASAAEINAAASSVGAFGLTGGSKDAALIVTLPAGAYSAVVTGANGAGGAALVEVYELPAK